MTRKHAMLALLAPAIVGLFLLASLRPSDDAPAPPAPRPADPVRTPEPRPVAPAGVDATIGAAVEPRREPGRPDPVPAAGPRAEAPRQDAPPAKGDADPLTRTLEWRARRGAGGGIVEDQPPALIGLEESILSGEADEPGPERPVPTAWSEGDRWTVLAYYCNLAAPGRETWSAPLTWHYRVSGHSRLRDQEVLEVVVELGGEQAGELEPATFYVTPERRLVALRTDRRSGGETSPVYVFFDDDPSAAASGTWSIVPFELPPAGARGRSRPAGAIRLDPLPESVLARFPSPDAWVGAGEPYLAVEFANRLDRTTIRQLWAESDPRWPAVSLTPSRRVYRVRDGS